MYMGGRADAVLVRSPLSRVKRLADDSDVPQIIAVKW
jgi:hypothetical protein